MSITYAGRHVHRDNFDEVADANGLRPSQAEADTRILLHAKHASSDIASVIIIAEDTDVVIPCLAFQTNIGFNMFVNCGSNTRTRFIDISKVARAVGHDVCDALRGMQAYTGDDTIRAIGGHGKLSTLKLFRNNVKFQ